MTVCAITTDTMIVPNDAICNSELLNPEFLFGPALFLKELEKDYDMTQ